MDVYNSAKGHLPKCIFNHFMASELIQPPQYQTAPESPILIGLTFLDLDESLHAKEHENLQ